MDIFEPTYCDPKFERIANELNEKFVRLTKKLSKAVAHHETGYNLWEFKECLGEFKKPEYQEYEPEFGDSSEVAEMVAEALEIRNEAFSKPENFLKFCELGKKKKLSENKDAMELLRDKNFCEYFPLDSTHDFEGFTNLLAASIKSQATILTAKAIKLQLMGNDPDASDEKILFPFTRPLYKMFDKVIDSEHHKLEFMLRDNYLDELEIDEEKSPETYKLRDKLFVMEPIDRFLLLIDKTMNYLDRNFDELPRLLQRGVILYKISKDPESRKFYEEMEQLSFRMRGINTDNFFSSDNPEPGDLVSETKELTDNIYGIASKIPNYSKRYEPLTGRIPGLELLEPVKNLYHLEALEPIPTIQMIVDAAIFARNVVDFRY